MNYPLPRGMGYEKHIRRPQGKSLDGDFVFETYFLVFESIPDYKYLLLWRQTMRKSEL